MEGKVIGSIFLQDLSSLNRLFIKRKERQKGNGKEREENRKENKVLVITKLGSSQCLSNRQKLQIIMLLKWSGWL